MLVKCYWSVRFWFIDWCCFFFLFSRTFIWMVTKIVTVCLCWAVSFVSVVDSIERLRLSIGELLFVCPVFEVRLFLNWSWLSRSSSCKLSKKTTAFFFTVYNCTVGQYSAAALGAISLSIIAITTCCLCFALFQWRPHPLFPFSLYH